MVRPWGRDAVVASCGCRVRHGGTRRVGPAGEMRLVWADGGGGALGPPRHRVHSSLGDLVVHDAIVGNKQAAADRYGVSWRAVNNMCRRVAEEALDRIDLLDGLVAIAIDEAAIRWSPRSRPGRPGSCGPASRTGRASSGRRGRASHRAPVEPPAAAGRRCPVVPLSIGRIRTNARGFHNPEAFITMIMLDRAGITPELPRTNAS